MALPTNRTIANTPAEHVSDHNALHTQYNDVLASTLTAADFVLLKTLAGQLGGAWTAYTPTLTQSATVTKTVTYARYIKIGRLVVAQGHLAVTGAGTAAQPILIGLPVASVTLPVGQEMGTGHVWDSSAGQEYKAHAGWGSTTTFYLYPSTGTAATALGQNVMTAALASPDNVNFSVTYESAT